MCSDKEYFRLVNEKRILNKGGIKFVNYYDNNKDTLNPLLGEHPDYIYARKLLSKRTQEDYKNMLEKGINKWILEK